METNENLRKRFIAIREKLNISQAKLGKSIGLSSSGISSIESGKRNVTDKHIKLICTIHNINEDWFRYGKGPMFKENDETLLSLLASEYNLSRLQQKVISGFLKLSDEQRAAIISAIEIMATELSISNNDLPLTAEEEKEIDKELENIRQELVAEKKASRLSLNADENDKKYSDTSA